MSKKTLIHTLIILCLLIIIGVTMLLVDWNLIAEGRAPMFSVTKNIYEDGGTIEYIGFGYKIFKYNKLEGPTSIKVGTLFMQYE